MEEKIQEPRIIVLRNNHQLKKLTWKIYQNQNMQKVQTRNKNSTSSWKQSQCYQSWWIPKPMVNPMTDIDKNHPHKPLLHRYHQEFIFRKRVSRKKFPKGVILQNQNVRIFTMNTYTSCPGSRMSHINWYYQGSHIG